MLSALPLDLDVIVSDVNGATVQEIDEAKVEPTCNEGETIIRLYTDSEA